MTLCKITRKNRRVDKIGSKGDSKIDNTKI